MFVVALAIAGGMIALSFIFGPKVKTPIKAQNFECGMPQAQKPTKTISINFYRVAVLFLVFDIEIIYLYPWASYIKEIPQAAFVSGLVFILIFLVLIFYVIKRGALKWD